MSEFKIITNTTADLPKSFIEENNLKELFFSYIVDGESYSRENELDYKAFYEKVRSGSMPSTSQVTPEAYREAFTEALKESSKLLYLSFTSGMSGSCGNAILTAREMMEENPDIEIRVIDSLCASMGEGLFVWYAVQLQKQGKSFKETADWLEAHVQNFVHLVTVDDLNHLHRGGRVSKTSAILGTMINIKPIIHVNEEGRLIVIDKIRGRKKALHHLVDLMEHQVGSYRDKNEMIMISHGDCLEDAEFVKADIEERFGYKNFMINPIGPTIGAHSGPGTIALFFMGDVR